jgi:hypothetical protein
VLHNRNLQTIIQPSFPKLLCSQSDTTRHKLLWQTRAQSVSLCNLLITQLPLDSQQTAVTAVLQQALRLSSVHGTQWPALSTLQARSNTLVKLREVGKGLVGKSEVKGLTTGSTAARGGTHNQSLGELALSAEVSKEGIGDGEVVGVDEFEVGVTVLRELHDLVQDVKGEESRGALGSLELLKESHEALVRHGGVFGTSGDELRNRGPGLNLDLSELVGLVGRHVLENSAVGVTDLAEELRGVHGLLPQSALGVEFVLGVSDNEVVCCYTQSDQRGETEEVRYTVGDVDNDPIPLESQCHSLKHENTLSGTLRTVDNHALESAVVSLRLSLRHLLSRNTGQLLCNQQALVSQDSAGAVEELPVLGSSESVEGTQLIDIRVLKGKDGSDGVLVEGVLDIEEGSVNPWRIGVGEDDGGSELLALTGLVRGLRLLLDSSLVLETGTLLRHLLSP